jgi:inositol-pentakisphosphate 2-kinase
MANILKTHPSDWKYVSEGGATVVLSYIGPSRIPFDGKVLRLRKSKRQHSEVVDPLITFRGSRLHEELDDPAVDFQLKCMARLIPPEHLPKLETVLLDGHWLKELALLQDPHRPQSRRVEDGIDLTRKNGVLATDLVGGNELSVEIKVRAH